MLTSFWQHRRLVMEMTRREVVGRYKGSLVGLAWSFFNPIFLLTVYVIVFSGVFKMRWNVGGAESEIDFALIMFVGMMVHGVVAECLGRAPTLILSNANLVKKVVFPVEILPFVMVLSATFHFLASLGVMLVAQLLSGHFFPFTVLLLPLMLFPLILLALGLSFVLAATGVYLRDIAQMTGIFTTVLMFLSPVFYPVSAVPPGLSLLLQWNPMTYFIEAARSLLIFRTFPDVQTVLVCWGVGLVITWAGFWWFQKTRKGFADVL